jgi:hypothetical protein
VAKGTDGMNARVFFIQEGSERPNQYGGTDLYYLKGDQWFVARTRTKPETPDYVSNEPVQFYADPHVGFYVVGASGDKWLLRANPNVAPAPPR